MALVLRGGSAVIWSKHQDTFPYIKGMLVVFLSWVVSPICSGALPIRQGFKTCTCLHNISAADAAAQRCWQPLQVCNSSCLPALLATSPRGLTPGMAYMLQALWPPSCSWSSARSSCARPTATSAPSGCAAALLRNPAQPACTAKALHSLCDLPRPCTACMIRPRPAKACTVFMNCKALLPLMHFPCGSLPCLDACQLAIPLLAGAAHSIAHLPCLV